MKTILLCFMVIICCTLSSTVNGAAGGRSKRGLARYHRPIHHNVRHHMRNPVHMQQQFGVGDDDYDYGGENGEDYYIPGYNGESFNDGPTEPVEVPTEPVTGGTVYTRWGRTECADMDGTSLVYEGYAAGTHYYHRGGGANYICITKEPKYHDIFHSNPKRISDLYGAEYEDPVSNEALDNLNVPCAVCHTSRSAKLMIPGQFTCPDDTWTEEYNGYLMSGLQSNRHTYSFECVDLNIEVIEGSTRNTDGALFYNVGVKCGKGLPCSDDKFVEKKPITCVVCTK